MTILVHWQEDTRVIFAFDMVLFSSHTQQAPFVMQRRWISSEKKNTLTLKLAIFSSIVNESNE